MTLFQFLKAEAGRAPSTAARSRLLFSGLALTLMGLAGFFVVADDLRHRGEAFGVAAVLISGLAFIGASRGHLASFMSLAWLPVGLLLGTVGGAAFDVTGWGFLTGLLLGTGLARLNRMHHS